MAKKKIVHWTSLDLHKRANAAFLMGTYLLIYHDKSPEEAAKLVQHGPTFLTFRLAVYSAVVCGQGSLPHLFLANHLVTMSVMLSLCLFTVAGMHLNNARRTT